MLAFNNTLYDAIVVSDETDRTLSGAVRIKIIGITDDVADDFQPLALPVASGLIAVPTKGTYLKIYFEEGDIHCPVYIFVSPQKSYLPDDYINNYPNTAVANLGSDDFQMVHDRLQKNTVIAHDSNSTITINGLGQITQDSELAYENTGSGANTNTGKRTQAIITEGTPDIFTALTFSGGSEYFSIAHISKASVDGSIQKQQQKTAVTTDNVEDDSGQETKITKTLVDEQVEFLQAKNIINVDDRKVKFILIGNTGNNSFIDSTNSLLDSSVSTHYVIGNGVGEIVQMIDTSKAGSYGNKGTWKKETSPNKICVSLMCCSDGKNYSESQYVYINKIIQQTRDTFGDSVEIATIAEIDSNFASTFGSSFNRNLVG